MIEKTDNTLSPNERLRSIRERLRLTRTDLFERYGLSSETLKSWENGKLKLTEKALKRCIDMYRNEGVIVSKSWLLHGEGLDPRMSFELNQYFSESELSDNSQDNDEMLMLKEADAFKKTTPNAIVMLVSTDEMLPYYHPGDYVGGRLFDSEKAKNLIGYDCLVVTTTGEKYFRRLVSPHQDDTYNLACHNPGLGNAAEPVLYDIQIKHLAPIIWHRKPLPTSL